MHLAYVAAVSERLEPGTAIVILPQRNPLVLAKQAASPDILSGGRLLLGRRGRLPRTRAARARRGAGAPTSTSTR
ncbi:LLM class flavin-dependent oxidoreductase [Amycolatopsis sp.]|uniref:LLM class flavin-dependent oxidoreductase n=1 Tax=Amycolatopsis sp. TaxID=37632 RepID=UPI0039C890C6